MIRVIKYVKPYLEKRGIQLILLEIANNTTFTRSIARIVLKQRAFQFDFVVFNALASLLSHNSLMIHQLARLFNVPQIIYWHERDMAFSELEQLRPELVKVADRIASFKAMQHLAVSQASHDTIAERYGVNAEIVFGCSDTPSSFSIPVLPTDDPPTVIGCGTIQYKKGTDLFVETAIKVCQIHPTAEFIWLGAGWDYENWKQTLESSGFSNRILFPGHVDSPFMFLRRASVFFLSSRQDAFPLVNLEAMCLGRKVVTFHSGGAVEALDGCGVVIDNFNTDQAAEAILNILRISKDQRIDLDARQRYLSLYTPEKHAERLDQALRSVI